MHLVDVRNKPSPWFLNQIEKDFKVYPHLYVCSRIYHCVFVSIDFRSTPCINASCSQLLKIFLWPSSRLTLNFKTIFFKVTCNSSTTIKPKSKEKKPPCGYTLMWLVEWNDTKVQIQISCNRTFSPILFLGIDFHGFAVYHASLYKCSTFMNFIISKVRTFLVFVMSSSFSLA